MRSARSDQRPQLVGAAFRDQLAEFDGPVTFAAKIVAPGQSAQRIAMQHMLAGEADGAMHLVSDGSAFLGGFRAADLGSGRFEKQRVVDRLAMRESVGCRTGGSQRGRRLAGEPCQVVAPPGIWRS